MKLTHFFFALAFFLGGIFSGAASHAHPYRGAFRAPDFEFGTSQSRSGSPALYYGGPVLSNAKIYAVFWGPGVDAVTQKQIGGFYSSIVNSTYLDQLAEFQTTLAAVDGRPGTKQSIGRGTFAGTVTIKPKVSGANVSQQNVEDEIESQIAAGVLAKPDANTLYMIHFAPGVAIELRSGDKSCQSYCADHEGMVSKTYGALAYAIMPDQGGSCSFGCGAGDAFTSLTLSASHEIAEAITDPMCPPIGTANAFPGAWIDASGAEIGDKCTGGASPLTGAGQTYSVQNEWSNKANACVGGPYK
jgi:hypothetical protein